MLAYLKNHVGTACLRNQPRFRVGRTLFVSGERAAESPHRATYAAFERHEADLRSGRVYQRHIDHWRAVHSWSDAQVWRALRRWRINPHPAYRLGFHRVSCAICIFATDDQVATIRRIHPPMFHANASYEASFGQTIHRTRTLGARAASGRALTGATADDVRAALRPTFDEPMILERGLWKLPAGAFGHAGGPP